MGIPNEDSLFASFSECPVASFEGAPTYISLKILNTHLNACYASVHSNLGYETLCYIFFTAPPATYNIICTLPFVSPVNAEPTLEMPDLAPTAIVFFELVHNHAEALLVWWEYNDVDRAINWIIKLITPQVYFWTLRKRDTGYATVRSLDILSHLHATYGIIEDEDIQNVDMELKYTINGETQFKYIFAHIKSNQ